MRMLQTTVNNEMHGPFPNMYICLRIYLSLRVKNCSGERSFSALKRLKNYLWSTLKDDHILAVLRTLNFSSVSVLDQFLERLTREVFK